MIEKFFVLAVLKDGSFRSAGEIARALEEDFSLKCRANTVRKDLERYLRQYLVRREKMSWSRRCWHYRITGKGLGRYEYFKAKRENTPSTQSSPSDGNAERKSDEDSLLGRTVRAVATIKICDATSKLADDPLLRKLASYLAIYSLGEYREMAPRMPDELFCTSLYWLCRSFDHQPVQRASVNEFLLMCLVSRRNDEIACLQKTLFLEAGDNDRHRKLYEEADSRNRSLIRRIEMLEDNLNAAYWRGFSLGATCGRSQTTLDLIGRIEMLEDNLNVAYWKGFNLGATYGIYQTTLNLMVAQSDAILSLLKRRFEKEQMEREHFNAILSRRSMNERWWDMLPTAPAGPSPLR